MPVSKLFLINAAYRCLKGTFLTICTLFILQACAQAPGPAESMAGFCQKYPRPEYKNLERIEHASAWFELYQVAPGVVAIFEPHQWQEVISYLIIGNDEALLFDTGNGIADIAEIVKDLTDKPVSVLNSHTHYDHVGGNFAFKKVYGMDTTFTRQRQAGQKNKDIAIEVSAQALCTPLPQGVSENTHTGLPFVITDFIQEGHIIDLGDRQLEVIHIPGHTPDAIALIDRAAGLLWTGDSYYSGPIWLYAPETDLDAFAESLKKLILEVPNVNALLPAHNTPWVNPEVLPRVLKGFESMLAGRAASEEQGDGMLEYKIPGEETFSFLMRDEPLPYANQKAIK